MVNRQTTLPVSSALGDLRGAPAHSEPVFAGGPVELDTVFALARASRSPDGASPLSGGIFLITSRPALEKSLAGAPNPGALRVYLGYCGWAPHQLENEVRVGGWYIFNPSADVVFDEQPNSLWSRLIAKAEARLAWLDFTHR